MKLLGYLTAAFIILILGPIWKGYVLTKLWLWFIVSTFSTIPLSLPQAIGIGLIVSFLTHQINQCQEEEATHAEKIAKALSLAVLAPAVALLFGCIVKAYL